MGLPSPTFSFTIPSVYDGTQLDCRLFHPKRQHHTGSWTKRGAIVAHPYAPLGGCYDDPVVNSVAGQLLQLGYIVSTFNFRGAGDSEGRTSWTAKPEAGDYVSVYGFMLDYLRRLDTHTSSSNRPDDQNGQTSTASGAVNDESKEPSSAIELILGGYSYGSMIASHLPKVEDVLNLFSNPADSSPASVISSKAEELSKAWNQANPNKTPGDTSGTHGMTVPKISYLLVSPILPPISLFVTMFSRMSFISGMSSPGLSLQGVQVATPSPDEQLRTNPTLVIYGTKDIFTPQKKIRRWVESLRNMPGSKIESREIDGAGHFWVERDTEPQMRQALREWLRQKR
ncbi:hypothetical protein VTN77DRAFT_4566 [Rasamsonia byssochlamydoides]|uniref:uncharacterized protein n=1 Tax=Rasamsonia byssochlamydoides TaxID=89139 RepID=UPI00374306C2